MLSEFNGYNFHLQTLLCGLIGLPPSNGVLPQSPMHTRSLAVLKKQVKSFCLFVFLNYNAFFD